MENIERFKIIGVAVKTCNQNYQAAKDLGKLWFQFMSENISSKISNKISEEIYAIYTDYESNYNGKYLTLIGYKVNSLATVPDGLVAREFKGGKYKKFTAKGNMPQAAVETWKEIWAKDAYLNREYSADFEVYGVKSQNGENAEVDIYLAIN